MNPAAFTVAGDPGADAAGWSDEHIQARVVWYYYVGGITQQAIADRLHLTRLKVNRIVVQARAEGHVRIDVRLPLASCVALEEQLKARYALQDVAVVPAIADENAQQSAIGEAAGRMLDPLITNGVGLGVSWGRTVRSAARSLSQRQIHQAFVVSLMGGLTRGSGTNTFEISTEFAGQIGADCYYFVAPIYCPSAESRNALLSHHGLSQVMRRARDGSLALVSTGDLSSRSLLATTQTVTENLEGLRAAGAVGDLLGMFLDEYGRPVNHPLNHCVMALTPAELKAYPVSILASGGMHKLPIIRAVLNARYVTRLVTDELVAGALL